MKELVNAINTSKEQIITWAYMNRVLLSDLAEEEIFQVMKKSVEDFMEKEAKELNTEYDMWDVFLDSEYIV